MWSFSAGNMFSLRSRISVPNSTEQTNLAPDHLLTAPSPLNVEAGDSKT